MKMEVKRMTVMEKHLVKLKAIPDAELREEVERSMAAFPDRLRQIRESASATLRDIEKGTGIRWQMIGTYERGEVLPDFRNLCLLALYYGVSADWLMGGEWN